MLSTGAVIGALAAITIVFGVVCFILLRKKQLLAALISPVIFGVCMAFVYSALLTRAYILDHDLEGQYSEKIVLFPSVYNFKNGQTVTIRPTPLRFASDSRFASLSDPVIVNDTNQQYSFSVTVYSSDRNSHTPRPIRLPPYSVKTVQDSVDYIYTAVPSTIRGRGTIRLGAIN